MTEENAIFLKYVQKDALAQDMMFNFFAALSEMNITPYKAQEDAIIEIMSGNHLILSTPTGSGKSLVAFAMHFKGMCENKRSYYTCPIKALVSEKFFALCKLFKAENVGMITSDASINKDAPIICCTAEVLANLALSEESQKNIDYVVMDEFHYFSDKDRGVAWQLPLLALKNTTFLLMSATLGNCEKIKTKLTSLTNKTTSEVSSMQRPVPLHFSYSIEPLHETIQKLLSSKKYPIYLVNFTQAECVIQAQNCMSINMCDKQEKASLEELIKDSRFDTPFGKEIKKFIKHGIGIHHAGLLPKYRLLIEKLSQKGVLKVIMGTDTLGVGVNVPITTVLFTRLCKFDGVKMVILSVRDFRQIAGRAGRKGFDDEGFVIVQAPEHVIENIRQESRFSADQKKKKKIIKKEAPQKNYTHYDEDTFNRLINDQPESMQSQFKITHGMILTCLMSDLGNVNKRYKAIIDIINNSFESDKSKSKLRQKSALLLKSLINSGIISKVINKLKGNRLVINDSLQKDFSLNHSLSIYLLDAVSVLKKEEETYALEVLSIVEAISENPTIILQQQLQKKRNLALAQMKAEGIDFDERVEKLDKIEHDKPLADFIYQTFNQFIKNHPWLENENIHPKSIVQDMFNKGATFNEYINEYSLAKSEGVLLRYISQVYKTLVQNIPNSDQTESVLEIIAYLKTMIEKVDTSLIEEWEGLSYQKESSNNQVEAVEKIDPKVSLLKAKAEIYYMVQLLALKQYDELAAFLANQKEYLWTKESIELAMMPFYEEYEHIVKDYRARNPLLTKITLLQHHNYEFIHTLLDDKEDNMWYLKGNIIINDLGLINITLQEISN